MVGVMPAPVPSAWADKVNNDSSVSIDDVTPVVASKPQKTHYGHCRTLFRGPRTMTQSPARTSKATTPLGEHVACPGEASAIKEVADTHVMRPWMMTRSPVQTSKATMSPGKHVARTGEALAVKEASNIHDNLRHGMVLLQWADASS
jgi:hypothetical protein